MRLSSIGALGFLAIAAAAVVTVWFVGVMKPTSALVFLAFSAWLVSPYIVMAALLGFLERRRAAPASCHAAAILICLGGVLFLADLIFWHTDAQGAIAVLMAPLFQGIALLVLLPIAWALSRIHKRQP